MMADKIHHPVDHGWAWMVCLGTGIQAFFIIGGLKSMGVLFMTLVEMFDAPPSLAALTLGLVAAGFAIFALLANAVAVMVGFRKVALCGAVMCSLSGFLSMWAMNIYYVIISLGLLSGLAFGAMATPSVVLLNLYFDERKSLANGLAMVGSSIGQLCLPYVMTYFVDEFGYKGAMLLYTGVCLQTIPAALLLRPLEFWIPKSKKPGYVAESDREQKPAPTEIGNGKLEQNHTDPAEDVILSETSNPVTKSSIDLSQSRSSLYTTGKNAATSKSMSSLHNSRASLQHSRASLYGSRLSLKKRPTLAESTGSILLGLSVQNLAPLGTDDSGDIEGKPAKRPHFCTVLFDRDLMKSLTFWLLFLALGIGHAGFIDACLYLPSVAFELFGSKYVGAMLIAIMGGFDIGGRIGGGYFADLGLIRRTHLTGIAMTITGAATFVVTFYPIFPLLVVYSMIMGLVGGIYRILLPVLVRDLFGPAKLSAGVGLCYLSLGLVILPMPTLLGYMKQVYSTYLPAMMLCGVLLMAGGVIMFFIPLVQRLDQKRTGLYSPAQAADELNQEHDNISITREAGNDDVDSDEEVKV